MTSTDENARMDGMACTPESGTCSYCQQGCTRKPGWFLPGEAEKAAELMGLPLAEFFSRHLAVDWWEDDPGNVFVLSPALVGEEPGTEFPGNPRGTCVFYREGRCQIHAAKPIECREHWCGDKEHRHGMTHEEVADAWRGHRGQITELLGDEPMAESYGGGILGLLGW